MFYELKERILFAVRVSATAYLFYLSILLLFIWLFSGKFAWIDIVQASGLIKRVTISVFIFGIIYGFLFYEKE